MIWSYNWSDAGEWPPMRKECEKSETGQHEWVHVGFMQLKYACRFCDQDKPHSEEK